jgi:hypothetical protein
MARGQALTIGLNAVDPKHYEGWSGELNACEADANDMARGSGTSVWSGCSARRGRLSGAR